MFTYQICSYFDCFADDFIGFDVFSVAEERAHCPDNNGRNIDKETYDRQQDHKFDESKNRVFLGFVKDLLGSTLDQKVDQIAEDY